MGGDTHKIPSNIVLLKSAQDEFTALFKFNGQLCSCFGKACDLVSGDTFIPIININDDIWDFICMTR